MTTLWLTRICAYKHTPTALASAEQIILHKVRQQFNVLKRVSPPPPVFRSMQDILLYEGRCAQVYWRAYKKLLPAWVGFHGRKTKGIDITNVLLNLGYHHLNTHVNKLCAIHNISTALGLLHVAKTEKSKPLVYDLMELFRADLVDREVLRYLRLKKKPVMAMTSREIGRLLRSINTRMEKKVYIRTFKQCHTYHYYMELQLLSFMKAVREQRVFRPIVTPQRHESRCA